MTVQTAYPRSLDTAYPGAVVGVPRLARSGANPSAKHVETLTIGTPANSTDYVVTVDGVSVTYPSDGSATEAEINAGILAAIAANSWLVDKLTAVQGTTTATVVLTAKKKNVRLVVAVSGGSLATATTTPGGAPIPAGTFAQMTGVTNHVMDVALMTAANNEFAGVLRHSQGYDPGYVARQDVSDPVASGEGEGLLAGDLGNFVRDGEIWVRAEETITMASDIYVRFAVSGANTILGTVRTDGDSSTAVQLTSAVFHDYDAAGSRVLLNPGLR